MTKRISAVIPTELHNEISNISKLYSRSLNYTIVSLLTTGIKEKTRNRGKKQSSITDNSSNKCKSDTRG